MNTERSLTDAHYEGYVLGAIEALIIEYPSLATDELEAKLRKVFPKGRNPIIDEWVDHYCDSKKGGKDSGR